MMKKNLILVTRSFPFSIKEASFIIPEMEALKEQYDITVISRNSVDEQIVTLDDSIKVYRYDSVADYNLLGLGFQP